VLAFQHRLIFVRGEVKPTSSCSMGYSAAGWEKNALNVCHVHLIYNNPLTEFFTLHMIYIKTVT